jgi:feruloyl esterase
MSTLRSSLLVAIASVSAALWGTASLAKKPAPPPQPLSCAELAAVALPDTTITTAEVVPAGTFQPPTGAAQLNMPEFCRIAGGILNHPTSRIRFEVWLPTQTANKRFLQVGNGGFGGNIQYGAMATRLREGYATASTDDGTSRAPGVPANQMLTFLGDFERLYDFKGRAVTLTTAVAKTLFGKFYASRPAYSYFTGCSTGGLEALAVAQRIGKEFDGVVGGSPAHNSAGLFTQAIWTYKYYQKISTKLALINNAALEACDVKSDGVLDGVIGNPEGCKFDPAVLLCSGADAATCLTAEQVDATRKIYEGPVNPGTGTKTGEEYSPGMPRGSELIWNGSQGQALNTSQPWYGMVLNGTLTFDIPNFDFGTDVWRALELTRPYGAQVTNPDLSTFRNNGGKLILWAGWNDPLWSQGNIAHYYRTVVAENGPRRHHGHGHRGPGLDKAALERTQKFARLFMAPGVGHCGGGVGPNSFDTFTPVVEWVEKGKAPKSIIATRFVNNQSSQGIERTRPLCPYPAVAKWTGEGDPTSADNFKCVSPRIGRGHYRDGHDD